MAEPARKIYDEDNKPPHGLASPTPGGKKAPVDRHGLRVIEGNPNAQRDPTAAKPELQALKNTEDQFAPSPKKPSVAQRLRNAGTRTRTFFWGSNKRKAGTLGGAFGTGGIIGIIMFFGFASGPLEFIHIAEILTHFHFGHLTQASELRYGKMMYDILTKGDSNIDVGNTRLNFLERGVKARAIADYEAKGIKPDFTTFKTFDGFTLDTTNPNSKYFGMSEDEAISAINKDLGGLQGKVSVKSTSRAGTTDVWDGKIRVTGDNPLWGDKVGIKGMVRIANMDDANILTRAIRVRVLAKYSVAGFHPLKKLKLKVGETVLDALKEWKSQRQNQLENGVETAEADTSGTKAESTDSKGNTTVTDEPGPDGALSPDTIKATLSSLKDFGKGAGKVVGGIGLITAVLCILKAVHDNAGVIRYAQIILPMMRMGMEAVSVGDQIKSNQDVDINELGALSQQFTTVDATTHQVTSDWSQAAPIESETGATGGIDVNQDTKNAFQPFLGGVLDWTDSGAMETLCSTAVGIATGILSIVTDLTPVGLVVNIATTVAGAVALPHLIDWLTNLLVGNVVNVLSTGAEWGNNIDYGARLAANQDAISAGGVKLSDQQVAVLDSELRAEDQAQFHSESLADRLFNLNDYRSVASNMLDQSGVNSPQSLIAKVGTIPNILSALFRTPAMAFSASAGATPPPYQYPFPEFGFSQTDLDNPVVGDPFDNATAVGKLLDNNNTNGNPDYIQKALDCFGVSITQTSDGWDAVPSTQTSSTGQDRSFGVNAYDENTSHYNADDCIHPAGFDQNNWLRIRFWIFDTGTMEGYACYLGDDQSCVNSSIETASTTSTDTTTAGSTNPSGVTFVSQRDPRWARVRDWTGSTIGSNGCVLSVESMIISTFTGKFVSPVELDRKYGSNNDPYNHYGLDATGMFSLRGSAANVARVAQAVKGGALVSVYAIYDHKEPFWGTDGHNELIYGVSGNNFLVYDPWDMPDPNNPTQPSPTSPDRHSLQPWPESNFVGYNIGFDIVTNPKGPH